MGRKLYKPHSEEDAVDKYGTPNQMNTFPENVAKHYASFGRALWRLQHKPIDKRDPQQLIERFDEFLSLCEEHDVKPLVASCAASMNMSWTTLRDIVTDQPRFKNYPDDARAVLKDIYVALSAIHEQALESAKQGQAGLIFLGKNYHDLKDVQEHSYNISVEATTDVARIEAIDAKYSEIPADEPGMIEAHEE